MRRLQKDEWGRPIVYVAEWRNGGGGSSCVFSSLNPAIFFVVSGLIGLADWGRFPDPAKRYPDNDRNGNEPISYDPVFCIRQTLSDGREISGEVRRTSVAQSWTVGNGIAKSSAANYLQAVGRSDVEVSGEGDSLKAEVKA